jgi:hypothetical protein
MPSTGKVGTLRAALRRRLEQEEAAGQESIRAAAAQPGGAPVAFAICRANVHGGGTLNPPDHSAGGGGGSRGHTGYLLSFEWLDAPQPALEVRARRSPLCLLPLPSPPLHCAAACAPPTWCARPRCGLRWGGRLCLCAGQRRHHLPHLSCDRATGSDLGPHAHRCCD